MLFVVESAFLVSYILTVLLLHIALRLPSTLTFYPSLYLHLSLFLFWNDGCETHYNTPRKKTARWPLVGVRVEVAAGGGEGGEGRRRTEPPSIIFFVVALVACALPFPAIPFAF